MRKILALAMVALLALSVAFAIVGCGQKSQETTTTDQSTMPPPETPMDTSTMMPDTMVSDTTVH